MVREKKMKNYTPEELKKMNEERAGLSETLREMEQEGFELGPVIVEGE
jgi:hypothetical protein